MYSKFSIENKKKFPIYFFICLKCEKCIILNNIKLSYNNKIILNYECECKSSNIVLFDNYYNKLQIFYNFHKSKCKCGKKSGIAYCYNCKVYTCISCYLRHDNHYLLGKKIAYDLLCPCKKKSQGKCNTCSIYYCPSCLEEKHKNHQIISFSELYNKIENEELDFYNRIDDNISKMTKNIDELKKKEIVNSLKKLYSFLNNSYIKSRKYPHYHIMQSIINMKIGKLEYEKVRYKPRPTKPSFLIFNDFKGKTPFKDVNKPGIVISCLHILENKKIGLIINPEQKLQIYSENFKYLEAELDLSFGRIKCFLPYQDNSILLFGNGEIFKFTYKPFTGLLKKLTKKGQKMNDCFYKAIYYNENSYIIKGNNIYLWNSKTQNIVTLIKLPLIYHFAAFEKVSDTLIFSIYEEDSFMYFDVEKKKIIKKFMFLNKDKTYDICSVNSVLRIKELLLLSLELEDSVTNHITNYLNFYSLEEGHLIKSDYLGSGPRKYFLYIQAINDSFAFGLTPNRIMFLIDINIYQVILIDQSNYLPYQCASYSNYQFQYIEEYGNGLYIVTFDNKFISLVDFGKFFM